MPSNLSRARLSKAFNEGRRSATDKVAENPYSNEKLRTLWERLMLPVRVPPTLTLPYGSVALPLCS